MSCCYATVSDRSSLPRCSRPWVQAICRGPSRPPHRRSAEKLSIAGTPEEVIPKLKAIADVGVNHMILGITDAGMVKAFTGQDVEGVADVNTQLRLIHDKVMPAFA